MHKKKKKKRKQFPRLLLRRKYQPRPHGKWKWRDADVVRSLCDTYRVSSSPEKDDARGDTMYVLPSTVIIFIIDDLWFDLFVSRYIKFWLKFRNTVLLHFFLLSGHFFRRKLELSVVSIKFLEVKGWVSSLVFDAFLHMRLPEGQSLRIFQ